MLKDENYICIQSWMRNKLDLKGTSLIVYAIIYGFCQNAGNCFCGSLAYLQEWTDTSRAGIIKILTRLIEKKYIRKECCKPTNKYYICNEAIVATYDDSTVNKVDTDSKQSLHSDVNKVNIDSKQSLHNNILDNNINNIDNNISNKGDFNKLLETEENIKDIIAYFNTVCKTNFRTSSQNTKKIIKARLKEGYTIENLKFVIDHKYREWGQKPFRFSNGQWSNEYLRPSTLFSSKNFENYLYEAQTRESSENLCSRSSSIDEDVSDITF